MLRRRQWHPTPVLLPGKSHGRSSLGGCSPWGRWVGHDWSDFTFTFHFHALEKEMETHSSVLAWRIPETGAPGGLPSMELHRVGHDWSDLAAAAAAAEDVGCGLALHVAKCYSRWCLCWHFCNWWLHLFISHPNKRRRLHNSKQVVENSKNQENYFDEAIKTYLIYIFTYLIFDQGFGLSEIQKNLTFNQ